MADEALETALLRAAGAGVVNTGAFAAEQGVEHAAVVGVLKSLEADGYLASEVKSAESHRLSAEALRYLETGSPEVQVFNAVPADGIDDAGLEAAVGKEVCAIGKGKCMKNKWLSRDKASGKYMRTVASVDRDELVESLRAAQAGALKEAAVLKDLTSRRLLELV